MFGLAPEQILGEEGRGLELADKWLGMGRVWVGASCCGKAERLFGLASEWAATRKQFGQPIGQFQAHRLQARRHGGRATGRPICWSQTRLRRAERGRA